MTTPARFAEMGERLNTRNGGREKPSSTAGDLWLVTKSASQVHLVSAPKRPENLLTSGCVSGVPLSCCVPPDPGGVGFSTCCSRLSVARVLRPRTTESSLS